MTGKFANVYEFVVVVFIVVGKFCSLNPLNQAGNHIYHLTQIYNILYFA
jgi:hypothetical protein